MADNKDSVKAANAFTETFEDIKKESLGSLFLCLFKHHPIHY